MKNRTATIPRARATRLQTYCAASPPFNALVWPLLAISIFLFAVSAQADDRPVILALGDSLTAGYGLPPGKSFPAQLEAALAEREVDARVVNGGVSGDTTAGGLARLDWLMAERPDLVIVELGANDGLRGLDPANTRTNLDRIISRIREAGASVLLAGMVAPPNLGRDYVDEFNSIFPALAEKHGTAFYPFFLEGVAMDPALNQKDGIHPTGEGIAVIVENMLPVVIDSLAEATP